jgi:hypothetical protein
MPMNRSGESEPTSVFALLAGARRSCEAAPPCSSLATPPRTDDPLTVVTSIEEARAAVDTAASCAQRLISIYTPDLEPQLYDQSAFLEIIKHFVLSRSFAKVRVLIAHPEAAVRDNNRFIAMGRRLSSHIDIRDAADSAHERASAYLIADDRAIVCRLRADSWHGIADFDNPPAARAYLAEFDALWNAGSARKPQSGARAVRA